VSVGASQGGYEPPPPGRRIRSRLHRGEFVVSAAQTRRHGHALLHDLERPERDQREVTAELSRPDEPGGEQRCP